MKQRDDQHQSTQHFHGNVELTDADHHVVSLVDKIKLNMSVFVRTGRGYEPADIRDDENNTVGGLKVDASFSPVKRVSYSVENARFEKRTDLGQFFFRTLHSQQNRKLFLQD